MKSICNLVWTSFCSSSNDQIKTYQDGTCLIAAEQSSGRGRRGSQWLSPPGGLYFSLKENFQKEKGEKVLPFVVAVACHQALKENCMLKWPNDLLNFHREKFGGILIESFGESVIIGVGINLHKHQYAAVEEGKNPLALATKIVANIYAQVQSCPVETLNYWQKYSWLQPGESLQAKTPSGEVIEGIFCGLGNYGELKIKDKNRSELLLHSGEIFEVRNPVK